MRVRSAAAVTALASAVVVLLAAPAAAHTQVIDTAPGDGASVEAPIGAVVLRVDHPPLEPLAEHTTITVTAPSGSTVSGAVAADAPQRLAEPVPVLLQEDGEWVRDYHWEAHPLRVPLTSLPETGAYTVTYSVADSDGHPTTGSFTFDYRGPTGAVPAGAPDPEPGPPLVATASPEEAAAAQAADAAPSAAPAAKRSTAQAAADEGVPAAALAAALALAVAGVAAVLWWWRSHRRPAAAEPAAARASTRAAERSRPATPRSRRRRRPQPTARRRSPTARRPG